VTTTSHRQLVIAFVILAIVGIAGTSWLMGEASLILQTGNGGVGPGDPNRLCVFDIEGDPFGAANTTTCLDNGSGRRTPVPLVHPAD
jgi:hypothetical protein